MSMARSLVVQFQGRMHLSFLSTSHTTVVSRPSRLVSSRLVSSRGVVALRQEKIDMAGRFGRSHESADFQPI